MYTAPGIYKFSILCLLISFENFGKKYDERGREKKGIKRGKKMGKGRKREKKNNKGKNYEKSEKGQKI